MLNLWNATGAQLTVDSELRVTGAGRRDHWKSTTVCTAAVRALHRWARAGAPAQEPCLCRQWALAPCTELSQSQRAGGPGEHVLCFKFTRVGDNINISIYIININ